MDSVTQGTDKGLGNEDSHHELSHPHGKAATVKELTTDLTTGSETVREAEEPTITNVPVKKIMLQVEEPLALGKDPSPTRKAVQIQEAPKRSTAKPKRILSHDDLVTKFQTRYYDEGLYIQTHK